ncbi:MAG: CZB domain-containing protein [Candidatus Eisenbacteria bacterium]|nr:CZB domain-containing protein [Candidatus Eisenbacteria bacterium]
MPCSQKQNPVFRELSYAIAAHGNWKQSMRKALDGEACDLTPARVRDDHACDLGKWLFEDCPPQIRTTPRYAEVVRLHAEFHAHATRVLDMARAGLLAEARLEVEGEGEFTRRSLALVKTLLEWKAEAA